MLDDNPKIEIVKKYEMPSFVRVFLIKSGEGGAIIVRYVRKKAYFGILKFDTLLQAVLFIQSAQHSIPRLKELDLENGYGGNLTIGFAARNAFFKVKKKKNERQIRDCFNVWGAGIYEKALRGV